MVDVLCNWPMPKKVFVRDILKETAEATGVSEASIYGKVRTKVISRARHKFFYDCMSKLGLGPHRVGAISGFNHATVMNGAFWHAKRNDLEPVTNYDGEKNRDRALAFYRRKVKKDGNVS